MESLYVGEKQMHGRHCNIAGRKRKIRSRESSQFSDWLVLIGILARTRTEQSDVEGGDFVLFLKASNIFVDVAT
jgi:N-dimethylarginine dimethylaminohydrolase